MTVSNSCETKILKFDDAVGVLLSEEARKKSSKSAETSRSALSVDWRGRSTNREKKKKVTSPNLNQEEKIPSRGVSGVGDVVRKGTFRGTTSRRRMEKAKVKKEGSP